MHRRDLLARTVVMGGISIAGCLRLEADETQPAENTSTDTPRNDSPSDDQTPVPCEATAIPAQPGVDWLGFQFDSAHSGYVPDETVPQDSVCPAWTIEAEGRVQQLLCHADTLIFPGSHDTGPARALDRRTGAVRWDAAKTVDSDLVTAMATPAADDSRLYLSGYLDGTRHIFALDLETGAELWRRTPDSDRRFGVDVTLADGNLYCYTQKDGRRADEIRCLDADSGDLRWAQVETWGTVNEPPAVHDGTVYVAIDGVGDDFEAGGVEAFDAATGDRTWRADLGRVQAAPTIADGRVFVARPDGPNTLCMLDATDGAEQWVYETLNGTKGSPAVANDRVVFGDSEGTLYGIDVESGSEEWTYDAGARLSQAAPIVVGETVICGGTDVYGDPGLRAVSLQDGTQKWRFITEYSVSTPPIVSAGTIYMSTDVGTIFALR